MKTTIIIFLLCWIAFPALHGVLFAVGMFWCLLALCVELRAKEQPQTVNWNGPNDWKQS